jgi:hypothetical protein
MALKLCFWQNKPVGDGDHEVLGMGSFGEYKLYGKSTEHYVLLVGAYQLHYKAKHWTSLYLNF